MRVIPLFICWMATWVPAQAAGAAAIDATVDITIDLRDEMAAEGRTVAYKFKIDRPGRSADDGWEPGPNRSLVLSRGAGSLQRAFGSQPGAPPPQRTGHIQRIAPLPSAFVEPREVQVWLPPGYGSEPQRRYPVLYLHDGQNVFDHVAAGAEWQVDETAQRLVLAGAVRPLIIVAASSTGSRRLDYTPVAMRGRDGATEGGGAALYARYLVQELKPFIDTQYRTQAGRAATAVGGSSLGGLVSMWLALNHGDVFGAALVVSPSTWWADEIIVAQVQAMPACLVASASASAPASAPPSAPVPR